jgi:DNA-binding NarL/FixJ family response regulator
VTIWHPPPPPHIPPTIVLSVRQADVLAGICLGQSNAEIGLHLFLTEDSVKTHVKRLFAALGARNRWHAAAMACSGQVHIEVPADKRRRAA